MGIRGCQKTLMIVNKQTWIILVFLLQFIKVQNTYFIHLTLPVPIADKERKLT